MRIALPQYQRPPIGAEGLTEVERLITASKQAGAEIVCFPEWFLGVQPVSDFDEMSASLARLAADSTVCLITGNIPRTEGRRIRQTVLVIAADGTLTAEQDKITPYRMEAADFEPGSRIEKAALPFGTLSVLNGLDAVSESVIPQIEHFRPNFLVMQMNPSSQLEAEALKELALARSGSQVHAVLLPSLIESYEGDYAGGRLVAAEGEVAGEAMSDEEIMVCDVWPESFLPFDILEERPTMPELLRQKLLSELPRAALS